jgi:sortase A
MTSTLDRVPQRLRALLALPGGRSTASAPARSSVASLPPLLWALMTVSLLAGWFVLYATLLSGLQQHRDNAMLYKQFRKELAAATVPIGQPIASSTPIALLRLPAAGIPAEVVVEGTAPSDLKLGVGHLRSTPLPGQAGVSVLYGRSLTYGGPFAHISGLAKGTAFSVTTGQGTFNYVVDSVRRVGDPLPSQLAPDGSRLLLETSTGSVFDPSDPLYVDATLQGKPVPAATAPLASVSASEQAFGTDRSHLPQLVLWLQGLLIAVLLTVWGALRWGRSHAWLIGVPVVVAMLWGVTANVMGLLPNLV